MADLTNTVRWVRYEPDLLGNRALERPFYFELNGSMSKEQLSALREEIAKPMPQLEPLPADAADEVMAERTEHVRQRMVKRQAETLEPFIRFGREPLNMNRQPVTTLHDYFDVVTRPPFDRVDALLELAAALGDTNSMDARTSFSFGRLSGGFTSTTSQRNGKAASQTAAR